MKGKGKALPAAGLWEKQVPRLGNDKEEESKNEKRRFPSRMTKRKNGESKKADSPFGDDKERRERHKLETQIPFGNDKREGGCVFPLETDCGSLEMVGD